MTPTKQKLAALATLTAVYFIAGKLGLALAYVHPSATAVWPPTGIALAALLLFGYDLWPAILLGAFLVNITTDGSALVCIGIAVGNTIEAVAGAWLVNRYARGRNAVYSTPDVFTFALFAGLLSTSIAATFGATSLVLGGYATWATYTPIWTTWWMGDAAGAVIVAPLLILWMGRPRPRWRRKQIFEAAALFVCLVAMGLVVFDGLFDVVARNYPLEYVCMPLLLWVSFRFGEREAASATAILSATAIWGTLHGYGPFGRESQNESLLLLQTFLSVVGVTTLGLAAAFAERRIAEEQSHFLAVSDPLTGLGNYRKLIDALEMEIRRSSRTGRPFALLLLDMDDLKRINDTFGHLVGSRALCRLAEALRFNSRNIDTAARFGGDEFALIIPELGPDLAREFWQDVGSERGRRRRGNRETAGTEAVRSAQSCGTVQSALDAVQASAKSANANPAPNLAGDPLAAHGALQAHDEATSGAAHESDSPRDSLEHMRDRMHEDVPEDMREDMRDRMREIVRDIAQDIARRISSHLANDREFPKLSVSIGAAQFPADGENIEQLLNAADQALYRDKRRKHTRGLVPPWGTPLSSSPAAAAPPAAANTVPPAAPNAPANAAPIAPSEAAEPSESPEPHHAVASSHRRR